MIAIFVGGPLDGRELAVVDYELFVADDGTFIRYRHTVVSQRDFFVVDDIDVVDYLIAYFTGESRDGLH